MQSTKQYGQGKSSAAEVAPPGNGNGAVLTAPRNKASEIGTRVRSFSGITSRGVWYNKTSRILVIATLASTLTASIPAKNQPVEQVEFSGSFELVNRSIPTSRNELEELAAEYEAQTVLFVGDAPTVEGTYLHYNSGDVIVLSPNTIRNGRPTFGVGTPRMGTFFWLSPETELPETEQIRSAFFSYHRAVVSEISTATGCELIVNF